MSRKRGKKAKKSTEQGDTMDTGEGRLTYGAGYEDEQGSREHGTVGGSGVGDALEVGGSSSEGSVQQAASAVVDTAQDVASTVVDTAQDAASAVADKAQAVTSVVAEKVDQVTSTAADKVEQLADTVAQTVYSGDTPPVQRQVAETTLNVLDRTAEYLRAGDLNLIVEDLRSAVRSHPLRSLALGLGLGYLARGAFFPSTGTQGGAPSQPQAPSAGYMPVPVYSGTEYDAAYSADVGTGYNAAYSADLGATTSGLTGAETLSTGVAGYDAAYSADVGATSGLTGAETFGTDTSSTGDSLSDYDTVSSLGLLGDSTDLGSSSLDAGSDLGGSSLGESADLGGSSFGQSDATLADDVGAGSTLTSDAYSDASSGSSLGDDADLLASGGTLGDDTASADQFAGLDDDATRSSDVNTMPPDAQLRQWNSTTSREDS